jgi:hypothetical protein
VRVRHVAVHDGDDRLLADQISLDASAPPPHSTTTISRRRFM